MPRATYGSKVKARVRQVLEVLLRLTDDQAEGIACRWDEGNPPRLLVRTKLRVLEALIPKSSDDKRINKRHIREALNRMEDFLKILEDHRVQQRGSEDWHFTLTLWSKDTFHNLKQFDLEWERKRPEKSKKQEEDLRTAELEETMKRREFLNLSTQTFIHSSLLSRIRAESKSSFISKRNLILHYLDHYVLQLIGYERLKPNLQQAICHECYVATRFAILFADQVFVPAVSYYQSPICRQVLSCYQDIFDTGIIRVIADAYSLEEFQENRLREYVPNSEEFKLYQKILDISELHPSIYSCMENTTLVLHEEWNKLIQNTDLEAFFAAKVPYELIPNDLINRLTTLTDKLSNQAFIVRNIYPQLFHENYLGLANELLKIINEIFFNWFTEKLKSGVVSDLVYLNQLSLKSYGINMHYNAIKTKLSLQYKDLFREIINCQPYELLMLKKDPVWNDVLCSSISSSKFNC